MKEQPKAPSAKRRLPWPDKPSRRTRGTSRAQVWRSGRYLVIRWRVLYGLKLTERRYHALYVEGNAELHINDKRVYRTLEAAQRACDTHANR